MKECSTCKKIKKHEEFHKRKASKNGLSASCKECNNSKQREALNKNSTKTNRYLKHLERCKKYRDSHKEDKKEYNSSYDIATYTRERSKTDELFKLAKNLRSRVHSALKRENWQRGTKFSEYIGCTLEELRAHIESQFQPGMNWQNNGRGSDKWHLDHKIPLASAQTPEELYKLCYYTNLQPLWERDNISKKDKIVY